MQKPITNRNLLFFDDPSAENGVDVAPGNFISHGIFIFVRLKTFLLK